jgi:transposase-like protein
MADHELQALRRRLDTFPRSRGRRIPDELRVRVATWVAQQRERGERWSQLARLLDVSEPTLQRWSPEPQASKLRLRPVVVDEAAPAARTVTLVAPSGLRLEGVTIADAIAILRALA